MKAFKTKLFANTIPGASNPPFGPGRTPDDPAAQLARDYYVAGLRSDAPLNWISNHLKEDQSDYGPIYVALKVLMAQAASAKAKCYKWHPDAKAEGDAEAKEYLPRTHPICRLMRRPNRWDSGRKMRARAVMQRALTGTWLGWRVDEGDARHSGDDKPVEIWTIPTGLYTAVPISPWYPNGAYRVMPFWPGPYAMLPGTWQAGGIILPAEQMIVAQHPHPLTYKEGLSPLAACAEELDTINGIGRARKSIIRRAPVPSGIVEMSSDVTFPDTPTLNRITQQVYQYLGGPDRAGRPAVLGPGMKWNPYAIEGLELPWGDTWDQMLSFVFAVMGTTKTMVGMDEASSYAALYAILKQNRLMVLQPELDDLADCFNSQLIEPCFGDEYGIEFEPEAVGDDELLEKQLNTDLQAGIRTFNEWRQIRKLPKIEGPKGEEYVKGGKAEPTGQPGQEVGQVGTQTEPKPAGEDKRPRNLAGAGSLPSRITSMLNRNGNGKH